MPVFRVILAHIFPHLDWIQRDRESLRIQSECGKMRTRITPNTNTFYAVKSSYINKVFSFYFEFISCYSLEYLSLYVLSVKNVSSTSSSYFFVSAWCFQDTCNATVLFFLKLLNIYFQVLRINLALTLNKSFL